MEVCSPVELSIFLYTYKKDFHIFIYCWYFINQMNAFFSQLCTLASQRLIIAVIAKE